MSKKNARKKKAEEQIIKIRGAVVPYDHSYETSLGTFTRKQLIDRYAHTVQHALVCMSRDYSPFKAGELIMRAVIALMEPDGPEYSPQYIITKLEIGLSGLGYYLEEGRWETPRESVIPELYVAGNFPADPDSCCRDFETGEHIGLDGVRHYLTILDKCLSKSERSLCDKAAAHLIKAIQLLLDEDLARNRRKIELVLQKALAELNLHITIAPWYERQLPHPTK